MRPSVERTHAVALTTAYGHRGVCAHCPVSRSVVSTPSSGSSRTHRAALYHIGRPLLPMPCDGCPASRTTARRTATGPPVWRLLRVPRPCVCLQSSGHRDAAQDGGELADRAKGMPLLGLGGNESQLMGAAVCHSRRACTRRWMRGLTPARCMRIEREQVDVVLPGSPSSASCTTSSRIWRRRTSRSLRSMRSLSASALRRTKPRPAPPPAAVRPLFLLPASANGIRYSRKPPLPTPAGTFTARPQSNVTRGVEVLSVRTTVTVVLTLALLAGCALLPARGGRHPICAAKGGAHAGQHVI